MPKQDSTELELNDDYYADIAVLGFLPAEADSFSAILQKCWQRDGKFGATVGGVAGAAIGGTVSLGSLSVPGWVLGIAVGGVEGTLICAHKPLGMMRLHEQERLKSEIKRVLDFSF